MNILETIKLGSKLLRKREICSHILDSEILLSNILQKSREKILVNLDQKLNAQHGVHWIPLDYSGAGKLFRELL